MQSYRKISNPLPSYYLDGHPIVNQSITWKEKPDFLKKSGLVPLTGQFSNLLLEGLDRLWDVSDIEIVQLFEDKKVRTLWVENDIVRKKIIRFIKE